MKQQRTPEVTAQRKTTKKLEALKANPSKLITAGTLNNRAHRRRADRMHLSWDGLRLALRGGAVDPKQQRLNPRKADGVTALEAHILALVEAAKTKKADQLAVPEFSTGVADGQSQEA